jgi:hypothetical protein
MYGRPQTGTTERGEGTHTAAPTCFITVWLIFWPHTRSCAISTPPSHPPTWGGGGADVSSGGGMPGSAMPGGGMPGSAMPGGGRLGSVLVSRTGGSHPPSAGGGIVGSPPFSMGAPATDVSQPRRPNAASGPVPCCAGVCLLRNVFSPSLYCCEMRCTRHEVSRSRNSDSCTAVQKPQWEVYKF